MVVDAAMLIVRPDFTRRIDLAGAGPCPRPIDIDRTHSGLTQLVSLRVYSFAAGMVIAGEAEEDEVFVTLLRGAADIGVDAAGHHVGDFALGTAGGMRTVYLPPHAGYRLTAQGDCDIAYARVAPTGAPLPAARGFAPHSGRLAVTDYATGMDLTLRSPGAGETLDEIDGAPERFLHLRSDDGGNATAAGERLGDWDAVVIAAGEPATVAIETGTFDILTISAVSR